ncbi:hypothetical protein RJ639_028631 [Escallonia herrerae]|uniref:Uncharacterized protein n=1 Tax=Escallonia herrerae TaxID=1293975 RepID=A0AA88X742_9ASTE|nr:hypothetical protein RJ639_028631 [Escallonia herrerae]
MANSRVARFITEVAPPQFVSVMRYRATKMLDTIYEEERGCSANDSLAFPLAPKSTLSSLSSGAASSNATNSKYLLKEIQITLSAFGKVEALFRRYGHFDDSSFQFSSKQVNGVARMLVEFSRREHSISSQALYQMIIMKGKGKKREYRALLDLGLRSEITVHAPDERQPLVCMCVSSRA